MQEEALSAEAAPTNNDSIAETPAAPARDYAAEVQQLASGLDRMHVIYRELAQNLSSDKIFDSLIAGLSCHPNFNKLVNSLVQEGIASFISQHDHDAPGFIIQDEPGVIGYEVMGISREPLDTTVLRVAQYDESHPTNPHGLDAFFLRESEWVPTELTDLLAAAILKAFNAKEDLQRNTYYWIDLAVLSDRPINEDSTAVETPSENDNGQAG